MSFDAPTIDYAGISPLIALTVGICVVLLSAVSPLRRWAPALTMVTLATAAGLLIWHWGENLDLVAGALRLDDLAIAISLIAILTAAVCVLLSIRERAVSEAGSGEYHALLLGSVLGMVLLAQASNLVSFFVAIEVLSIPLYILCATNLVREKSLESGLKYLIVGSLGEFARGEGVIVGSRLASRLRAREGAGDRDRQVRIRRVAEREAARRSRPASRLPDADDVVTPRLPMSRTGGAVSPPPLLPLQQRIQRLPHLRPHVLLSTLGGDHPEALRMAVGDLQVRGAHSLMELQSLAFHAVRLPAGRASLQPDLRIHVEVERQIRRQTVRRPVVHAFHELRAETARGALVRRGGIREAVADDASPVRQRRTDDFFDQLSAGGEVQGELRPGGERGDAVQQHVPDDLARLGATRLPSLDDVTPLGQQVRHDPHALRRLPGSFTAFQADEDPRPASHSHSHVVPRRNPRG